MTLSAWIAFWTHKSKPIRNRRRAGAFGRLVLEILEDRIAPATTLTWINATGGDWATPGNWDLNRVPTAGDDVIIPNVGGAGADVTITYSGGTTTVQSVSCAENFTISGGRLTLSGGTKTFSASGATSFGGGTFAAGILGAGTNVTSNNSSLDGVTIAAGAKLLMPANQSVSVYNGLTVDGTVEFTGGSTWLRFRSAAQTIGGSGTVLSSSAGGSPGLLTEINGDTLTIGAGLTVRGGSLYIGPDTGGGVPTGSVVNHGLIEGTTAGVGLGSGSSTFTNAADGKLRVTSAGGSLSFGGASWTNQGLIDLAAGTLNLGSTFTTAGIGAVKRVAGTTVNLTGTLTNTGSTLMLDGNLGTGGYGSWILTGTVIGGTVKTSNGAVLQGANGTLVGVTIPTGSKLLMPANQSVSVYNGLTVDGTVEFTGGSTWLRFRSAAQTIGGSGTVLSSSAGGSPGLLTEINGDTLTIGAGLTVRGGSLYIGPDTGGGVPTGSVVNHGLIIADGATVSLGGVLTSSGVIEALHGGALVMGNTTIEQSGVLAGQAGTAISIYGNLAGSTRNADQYAPRSVVSFPGPGTAAAPQQLEAMSLDLGNVVAGFQGNFAYGTIALAGNTYVKLVNNADNAPGTGAEAIYTGSLVVPAGTTLDLNGLHLYTRSAQLNGTVLNGSVSPLADGGPIAFSAPTPGGIAAAGEVDDWTFFGRAGQSVQVLVGTGGGGRFAPAAPALAFAQVQLINQSGAVVATATNTNNGTDATLQAVALPADGTYHLKIQADPNHAANTGNYVLSLWDATVRTAALNLNQATMGQLVAPYAVDRWTFTATANDQVQFDLLGTAATGIRFDLTGPNGFRAFTDATADSGLLTLPANGTYTLTVHAMQPAAGAYSFVLRQTRLTPLTSGVAFNGVFTGNGQAQLFTIDTPQERELVINLKNSSSADKVEVYAKFNGTPTRADYQYVSAVPQSLAQDIVIPKAAPGTWYILVYAETVAAPPESYSLTVTVAPVVLTAVFPEQLGTIEDAVLTLTGAGFDSGTTVALVAGDGTTYPAKAVQLDLPTQLSATFTAGAVPAGVYSVRVARGDGASATLDGAFTMNAGGLFHFHANLVTPSTLGYHVASTLYLEYSNTGDLAMPAPILTVTISQKHADGTTDAKPLLTLDPALVTQGLWTSTVPAGFSNTIQVLASGRMPGVIQPGESIQVPIYYAGWQQPWDIPAYPNFHPEVGYIDFTDTTPIPWSSLQAGFRPPSINPAAWDALFPNLVNQVGNTWGEFVRRMEADALYLGHLGQTTADLSQLWSFEVQRANGLNPVQALQTDTDAQVVTPGPALTVQRTFPNTINGRYHLGPFGRGWQWTGGWQRVLTVSDGTVTITDTDDRQRLFQPNGRGGYYSEPGDHGTLTSAGGGAFTLREADGSITGFGADGKVAYVADTNGNRVTALYTDGRLTGLQASAGQSLAFAYNDAGLIASITDSTGRTTSYTYDAANEHLLSVDAFDGHNHAYTYDTGTAAATRHALLSIAHPDDVTEHFRYDPQGLMVERNRNGDTDVITYGYGPAPGEVTAAHAVGGTVGFFYDARGLIAKTTDPLGNSTHYIYDGSYNLTEVIDEAGQVTTQRFDPRGNLAQSTGPSGAILTFGHGGPLDRMTSYTDANGNTTGYAYDNKGNLLTTTRADGTQERRSYNAQGQLSRRVDGRGQPIDFTYNAMGQVTRQSFADGTHADFTYDAFGNLTSASNAAGTTTYQYDPEGEKLIKVLYPGGRSLTFSYDTADRRTQSVDQDGFTVKYVYDAAGRLADLQDAAGSRIVHYTYDGASRLVRRDLGNNTFTTYEYDLAGNLLHLVNSAPDGTVNSRADYTYDRLGHVTTMTTLDGGWGYQYDPAGQLTRAIFTSSNPGTVPNQDLRYVYDLAGNRTETIINGVTTPYVADRMNQYTAVGSSAFTYDADGNLIAQTDADGTTNYSYDALHRLVGVSAPDGSSAYQYDALGNLIAVTQDGQTTQFVVDPVGLGNVVGAYGSGGSAVAKYTHGLELVSTVSAGGQASYYDFDATGSTVGVSGPDGAYQNVYRYLPFGEPLQVTETLANPFQFVGAFGVMHADHGLSAMRARFTESQLGRFLSPDPLGLQGGQANFYTYASNNPISNIDPTGTFDWCHAAAWGAAAVVCTYVIIIAVEVTVESGGFGIGVATAYATFICTFAGITAGGFGCKPPRPPSPPPPPPRSPKPPVINCPVQVIISDPGSADTSCSPDPGSHDPNAKTGPVGYGPQAFVPGDVALPYRIEFENDAAATAPAQRVVVTDRLGPNLDASTVQFSEVGFGDHLIPLPAGTQHYQTRVPMTYNGAAFDVLIELALDTSAGMITATFQSIDPTTMLPPASVLTGFLPPEDGTGRGLGHFSYAVRAKAGLPTGTEIRNVASIVFDVNPAITTDQVDPNDPGKGVDPAKQCLNTIDAGAPNSSVASLPAFSPGSFTVTWSGQDDLNGSGVDSFDVYVSDDGADFTLWQHDTTATSASFTGAEGHRYGFYSAAFDNAGNAQAGQAGAQTTTTVDATAPTSSVAALPAFSPRNFTVSWAGQDGPGGSGVASYDVFMSDNGGPFTPFLLGTAATSAPIFGTPGHRYAFYSVATDNAGNRQPTPAAAQAATTVVEGVSLQPDPEDPAKTALVVAGTDAAEAVTVRPVKLGSTIVLEVRVNGTSAGTFNPTGHVLVYGRGGKDSIKLLAGMVNGRSVKVAAPAVLDGGDGTDALSAAGGTANNILLGGAGNDTLTGGGGRDLLVGGLGADVVKGGGGEDVLTGDRTTFDASLDALFALLGKWGTPEAYNLRVTSLTTGTGPDDAFVLTPLTVLDDTAVDKLYGQGKPDWFLSRVKVVNGRRVFTDKVLDKTAAEVITPLV